MFFLNLAADYMRWHYIQSFRQLFHIWFNYVWFTTHFFSIPILLGSLFSPWKRMTERAGKKTLEAYAEAFVVNVMSRIVGFIMRSIIILVGLVALILEFIGIGIMVALWLIAPAVVVGCLIYGTGLLF